MAVLVGVDLGSVTAKLSVLDRDGTPLWSAYRRHQAEVAPTLARLLGEALDRLGDRPVRAAVAGSAGLELGRRLGLPFVQEVVAAACYVRRRHAVARTLVDIGGEDCKLVHFGDGSPELRMNGACAGGTGAYLDEMARLLNVPVDQLSELAAAAERSHPVASRCGVFAKTDVQALLARQVPHAEIARSVFEAVALQVTSSLARGLEFAAPVVFAGGPLTFMPGLRRALLAAMGLGDDALIDVADGRLLVAAGAALAVDEQAEPRPLSALLDAVGDARSPGPRTGARLRPLGAVPSRPVALRSGASGRADSPCFLGLDSGSTTTKLAVVDQAGRLVFGRYVANHGDPLTAADDCLAELRGAGHPLSIARGAATGYGEELIRAAFGCQQGLVETLAHFRAARALDPEVSFLLDIGGQDMKAVFAEAGRIDRIEINEACSSGCGTFLETMATSLGYTAAEFAELACGATQPYELGSRCTVFMNSRVKQALRDGAAPADIAAGLAYSVVHNALYKVLRITDLAALGRHLVVTGGVFRNRAVLRALEQMLGLPVTCPDQPELMGAYGAALTARDAWLAGDLSDGPMPIDLADAGRRRTLRTTQCRGCENRCQVTRHSFAQSGSFFTGQRCERVFGGGAGRAARGASLDRERQALLFDRPTQPAGQPRAKVGLPRALNLYEQYPFWATLLVRAGFEIALSSPSSLDLYTQGARSVMTENLCLPAKLVHGHAIDLHQQGVDFVLYPLVTALTQRHESAPRSYNCPIVTGYGEVVRSALSGVRVEMPSLTFADAALLRAGCWAWLRRFGVQPAEFGAAFEAARAAQDAYRREMSRAGEQLLARARAAGAPVVLLLARPYHHDPLINQGVTAALVDLGAHVITAEALPADELPAALPVTGSLTQWAHINDYYAAAVWAAEQPEVVVVQLSSFGCGPDAVTQKAVRRILAERGRTHTVIRIDDATSTGAVRLRLRSLLDTGTDGCSRLPQPASRPVPLFEARHRSRPILIPAFSRFCAPIVSGPVLSLGYQLVTLPPTDDESIAIGLRHVPQDVCYPAIATVGDVVRGLRSGEHDPDEVSVGWWQTGGQCRASSYLSLLRQALDESGSPQVPIVALTPDRGLHPQPGYNLNLRHYLPRVLKSAIYGDALAAMHYAVAGRSADTNAVDAYTDSRLAELAAGEIPFGHRAWLAHLDRAVDGYNQIATDDRPRPLVGLVGESYVTHNEYANRGVTRWLMNHGLEVIAPQFLPLFLTSLVNAGVWVREHLARRGPAWLLAPVFNQLISRLWHQAEEVLTGFRLYRPRHAVAEVAAEAASTISLSHGYGESWLTAGEIGLLARDGVGQVLCLQPFGCLASQVVSQGIARTLRQRYPRTTVTYLDIDFAGSEANFQNRLELLASQAKGG